MISPVVFEALSTLASSNPLLRARVLTLILILAACSSQAWATVAYSRLFESFSESAYILMSLMAGEGHCAVVDTSVLAQVAEELRTMGRCKRTGFNETAVVKMPVNVVVEHVVSSISNKEECYRQKLELLRSVVASISSECLGGVTDEEWRIVAPFLTQYGDIGEGVTERLALMSATDLDGEIGEAFGTAKRCHADGEHKEVLKLFTSWLHDGRAQMACAAYLAAPSILGGAVERHRELCSVVGTLGLRVWSEVDEAIDTALRKLLCGVDELARVLGRRCEDESREALLTLKRIVLVHPFIMARRTKCLQSICHTILYGLSEREGKYGEGALRVMEIVVGVVGVLPGDCLREESINGLCRDILQFLVEENRGENGVPEMFADLTIAVFKLVAKIKSGRTREVVDLVEKVRRGRGTVKRIAEASDNLFG